MFFPLLLRVLYTRRSIVQFCIQLIDNSLCILYHGIKKANHCQYILNSLQDPHSCDAKRRAVKCLDELTS